MPDDAEIHKCWAVPAASSRGLSFVTGAPRAPTYTFVHLHSRFTRPGDVRRLSDDRRRGLDREWCSKLWDLRAFFSWGFIVSFVVAESFVWFQPFSIRSTFICRSEVGEGISVLLRISFHPAFIYRFSIMLLQVAACILLFLFDFHVKVRFFFKSGLWDCVGSWEIYQLHSLPAFYWLPFPAWCVIGSWDFLDFHEKRVLEGDQFSRLMQRRPSVCALSCSLSFFCPMMETQKHWVVAWLPFITSPPIVATDDPSLCVWVWLCLCACVHVPACVFECVWVAASC